jgi:hypothetical protein
VEVKVFVVEEILQEIAQEVMVVPEVVLDLLLVGIPPKLVLRDKVIMVVAQLLQVITHLAAAAVLVV